MRIQKGGFNMTMINAREKLGEGVSFERIRRITGYLVGTMDKWNDAKRAEERDRVKHSMKTDA
jgi:anaerobic ribonucleoside-triphosphate reductase